MAFLLSSTPNSGITRSKKGKFRREATVRGPVSAIRFLRSRGGIRDDGGHELMKGRNWHKAAPGLIQRNGMSVDDAGELLHEWGYFLGRDPEDRPTEAEVLDFIENAIRKPAYREDDIAEVQAREAKKEGKSARANAEYAVRDIAENLGLNLAPEELSDAVEYMAAGDSAEVALQRALNDASAQALYEGSNETLRDLYEAVGEKVYEGDIAESRGGDEGADATRVGPEGVASEPRQREAAGGKPAEDGGKEVETRAGVEATAKQDQPETSNATATGPQTDLLGEPIIKNVPEHETALKAARKAFPQRPLAQTHFVRGWMAERGDAEAKAALVGSDAEGDGAAAAKGTTVEKMAEPDMFGTREGDERRALEREAEGRKKSDAKQKAPGEDGGLFDTRDTTGDLEGELRDLQSRMSAPGVPDYAAQERFSKLTRERSDILAAFAPPSNLMGSFDRNRRLDELRLALGEKDFAAVESLVSDLEAGKIDRSKALAAMDQSIVDRVRDADEGYTQAYAISQARKSTKPEAAAAVATMEHERADAGRPPVPANWNPDAPGARAALTEQKPTAPDTPVEQAKAALQNALDLLNGKPSGEMIQDAGEKIGGARKDRWAERGMNTSDLEGMSQGEAFQLVNKDAVWPKPDYAKMVDSGVAPEAAAGIKILRDSLAAKPREDSDEGRRNYIEMMGAARDILAAVKTMGDLEGVQQRLWDAAGMPTERGMAAYSSDAAKAARKKLFSIAKGNRFGFSISYGERSKIAKMIREGFPAKAEPWTRQYTISPYYSTGEDVQGQRFIVRKKNGGRIGGPYDTREEAEAAAKAAYESTDRSRDAQPERPHLDRIERTGEDVRNGRDIDSTDFLTDFGFRGVEYGNWVASDERQKSTNLAYEALHDLASTLGIPPRALSLGGQLALAFGARGKGRAAAHYEPGKLVINLTKMSGAGSLAHEWGHAFDHYFGSLDTDLGTRGAPKGASGWMDYTPSRLVALGNLRPEMAAAFDNLMSTIFKRDRTRADQVLALEQAIEKTQAGIEQQKERVAKTKEQMASAPSDFSKREYQRFIKRSEEWIAERERHLAWQNERLAEANDETKPIHATQVDTDFAAKSAKLPGKQGGKPYWTQPTEMLARSFEAYVFDKIASAEKVSQYLVQGVEEAGDFAQAAYPTGAERQAINEAYDRLFSTMDVREQDGEQMLFQKAPPVDTPPFEAWFGDSKVVDENGAPLAVYHGTVRQFDAFSRLRWSDVGGIYFAPTRTDAENYTEMLDEDDNPRVISAYLSIQNPVTLHGTDSHVITTQQIEDWKSRGFDGAKGVDEDGKVFEWVAFEPSQIKSTDNRGTFDANDDRIMYQRRLTEGDDPIFYSALERAIESSPTTRASADQWAATLSKAAGVKKEELEWTGLFDWLDMQEGPVSRDDLLGVIRDGGIKVEEHVLEADFDVSDIRDDEVFEGMSDDEIRDYVGRDENSPVPQFGNWTSDPENTGYRELLITLPIAQGGNPERAPATHWDQEAVVAHARFMPKTDADGKRVLFVEEVQSDWHQKGRDDGYQRTLSEEELAARDAAEEEARVAYDTAREALFDDAIEQNQKHIDSLTYLKDAPEQKEATLRGYSEKLRNEALDENQRIALAERFASTKLAQDVNRTRLALIEARQAASRRAEGSIPNAPFKASWPALVMKRMIRWAVDNGYDRIAWTTGAEQAERYSLGEHVGNLDVMRDGDQYLIRLDRSRAMDIIAENGMAATHEATGRLAMTKEQLKEAFGADIARRVVEATETKNLAIISSGDLRVGGEGMKAFYDRNLVNIANDLIKKYGGKVEPVSVDDVNKGRAPDTPELIAARANLAEVRANRVGYAGRHMPDAAREEYERAEDEAVSELNRAVAASRVASGMDAHPGFTITPELADAARSGFPLFARQQAARGAPTDAQVAEIAERLGKEMARLGIEDRIALRVGNGILKHVGDGTAQGAYFRRMIQVATDAALNPEATLHHESIHAIRALGLFNDSEWSALVKQATGDASLMGEINRQYRDLSLDKRQEEAVAEFYSRWRTERSQAKGFAAKAFQRLLDFVHALGRAIGAVRDKPLGAGTVMRRIESGKVGRRETGAGQAEMAPQFQRIIKRHAFPDANVEARYLTEREFGPPTPRGMKPADYDLFARKLLLDDLFWKSVMGEQLSYGFTPESLSAARVKIERFLNDNQAVREAVRRYKFSELLAETAASVEPQSITQAQNAEPKEGQPPRAANIRIDKLESADDIKAALESVANDFDQFKDARRGVVSHEETQRLASDLDMTVDQLMARRKGQAFNAHEMFAAREMLVASADNLVTLAKKAEGGSDTDLVNFRKAWIRHVAIQEQVSGLTAEAGRALNQFKMMAKTGGDINARMLKEIINTEGGRDGMEDVAKAIVGFSDDPGKMNRFARDAYKPTWRDKLFELWINGLLSGPATHVVNAVSNTLTALTQIPEFAAAATIGKVRSKFRPDTDRILRSEVGARAFGLIHGAKEGAKLAAEALRTGEGSDLLSKLEARTQRAIPGKKGEIVRIPSRLLIASDELYKGIARRSDLAAQAAHMATKEGLSGDEFKARVAELMAEPTDEMIDKANDFARYSTFQRPLGPIGQSISRVINVIPGLRLIVPFIRTPANIFKFSLARTLAAPIMKEVRDEIRAGGAQRDLAIARIMIGTGLMGAVMQLASAGIITGGDPDDDDARRLLHATGWQPYSIKIGNTYYSYQRLDPLATLLGVAADLNGSHENMSDAERTTASTTLFHSMMNQLTNKTFLSGIGNLIEAVEDPERFGPSFVGRLAGSVIPAFVAQANNAYGDTTQRDARSILERVESRIPGVSNTLPARRDIWGREIVREGGLGPDIASPFWTSEDRHDTVTEELLRTGVNLNVPSRRVGGEELSADDYDRYSQVSGQRLRLATEHLVNGSAWRRATVERRMELFDQVKNRVRRETRRSLGLSRH